MGVKWRSIIDWFKQDILKFSYRQAVKMLLNFEKVLKMVFFNLFIACRLPTYATYSLKYISSKMHLSYELHANITFIFQSYAIFYKFSYFTRNVSGCVSWLSSGCKSISLTRYAIFTHGRTASVLMISVDSYSSFHSL